MEFRVLGPLEVEIDGLVLPLSGARPRALLAALLMTPGAVVPTHRLVDALWGEDVPEDASNALHQVVGRLRRRLGPAGAAVVTRPTGYLLSCERSAVDAERFEADYRAAREVRPDDPAAAARLLDGALALWRGTAYAEFADGFARPAATRLDELGVAAQEDRAALALELGAPAEAVARARGLVAAHPLRERPVALLMRGLHADGRTAEALDAYRRHRDLVAAELGLDPPEGLRELEARILRDDLDVPGPPRPRPPARPRRRELPWRPGPLLGREREVALLRGCVAAQRLVTLVGPGGVGKTRLALELAHQVAADGGAVWWADLTAVPGPRVVEELARATGTEVPRTPDPAGGLCQALAAHRGLLCLDNAEHLLEPLAPVVERLVDAAPDLAVLATSRERLAVGPEHVHLLAPLPLPGGADRDNPAVRLFVARAAGFEADRMTGEDVALVAELCRRLDGLPLAIELGAAGASSFGLRELGARLGERLELLGGGRRTAATRHRTLRAVVDWSHGLLTGPEARLFARLGVFPGPFSLPRAEAVCADGDLPRRDVAALLARLVEQSVVQAGRGRFWLLETLRTYAVERLAPELSRVRRRHAEDVVARLAAVEPGLASADEAAAAAAVAELGADLDAAWAWSTEHDPALAVELASHVHDFAYYRQRLDLLEWGRDPATTGADHPRLPYALAAGAAAAWASGALAQAHALAARAVAAAGGPDAPAAARAANQLAVLAMFGRRTDEAVRWYRRAAALHRAAGSDAHALRCEISVSQAMSYAGAEGAAADRLGALVARARGTGNPTTLAWAHYVAGEAAAHDDADRARREYATAVEYADAVDNRLFGMLARSSALRLAAGHGPPADALDAFTGVLDRWEDLGNEAAQWVVLAHLVVLLARVGADRDGAALAGAVLAARDRHPAFAPDEARLTAAVAAVRGRLGDAVTADVLAEGADLPLAAAVARARRALRTAPGGYRRP